MSYSVVILGLFLIAGMVECGPILLNSNSDTEATASAASDESLVKTNGSPPFSRQGQSKFNGGQMPPGAFAANSQFMNLQRNPALQGLPTMPSLQGFPPSQFQPRPFPLPPVEGLNPSLQQSSSGEATKPFQLRPSPPPASDASKPVTSTTPDNRRNVEDMTTAPPTTTPTTTTTTISSKPTREVSFGNDQKTAGRPTPMKETAATKPMLPQMPSQASPHLAMGIPMPITMPMAFPWQPISSFIGMTSMANSPFGFDRNEIGGTPSVPFARPSPMWQFANPWFSGAPFQQFPSVNGFGQPNMAEGQSPIGIKSTRN